MVLAYLLIGFVFWAYVARDLALDLLGTLAGVAFYILTFPAWMGRRIAAWYINRSVAA
jgi:hypothetical protein